MTEELRFKIGQMLMAGFPSQEVDEQARRLVKDYRVGNFVLFARNFGSIEQSCRMNLALHRMVCGETGIAPIVAVDQEGGVVCRLNEGAALLPGAMAIAAAEGDAYTWGRNCADAMLAVGINANLAPVLDVNRDPMNPIIGARAFGDTPEKVKQYGIRTIAGMKSRGLLAVVKHFPGHGNVKMDSHLDVPCNASDEETLRTVDFAPFSAAFSSGADALMTCHVKFPAIDDSYPATLSRRFMSDLLRNEMDFQGIAITDCLEMGAIAKTFGVGESAVLAIEAGCDVLCFSHTYEAVSQAAQAIYHAVECGRITPARIETSYERIMKVKEKYHVCVPTELSPELARDVLHDPVRLNQNRVITEKSITLISDRGGLRYLRQAKRPAFFAPASLALTGNEDRERAPTYFSRMASDCFGGISVVIPLNGLDETVKGELCNPDYDVAVLGLYNARFREGQKKILRILEQQVRPLIVVLLGAPYDAKLIERADAVIAAYEYTPASVQATLKALEQNSFAGKLPVQL